MVEFRLPGVSGEGPWPFHPLNSTPGLVAAWVSSAPWLVHRLGRPRVRAQRTSSEGVPLSPPAKACCCYPSLTFFHPLILQSTRVEFDLPEYSVRRRYQDFDWLRNKLEESQPTHLIPVGSKPLQLLSSLPAPSFPKV